MRHRRDYIVIVIATVLLVAAFPVARGLCGTAASYLHHLSNFEGKVPYMQPIVRIDNANAEVYVISGDGVRIFNDAGMEIYDASGRGGEMGQNSDIAVDETGNLYHLQSGYDPLTAKTRFSFSRCNYKLETVEPIPLKDLPRELARFNPSRLVYRNGLFYFGDLSAMLIIVTDREGRFRTSYDLVELAGFADQRQDAGINDYFVDRDGTVLFTSPVAGKAYRVVPGGAVEVFGKRGSAPGRFGVPTSIVADARGNYLVADILRSVVIVFDREFRYITEFGYRGSRPDNMIGPTHLAIDEKNRLYVSQLAKRGVSVYQITAD